jgi:hypothetical protein
MIIYLICYFIRFLGILFINALTDTLSNIVINYFA